ncbi:MAG TPA: FliM/FliN family flagellar motor switch protein [Acidobacteriaceae bacterium]|jgi:flagellar motor switch protein FliN|nr:FliM/FliN family flagellar motor switch protein [Acidobacteriaceae bacterium]
MSDKLTYLDCWMRVASSLFSQALAGEPELTDSLPKPMATGSFGFAATLAGDEEGRFSILLDGSIAEAPLLGEGADQKPGWAELLRETVDAAVGELQAKTGRKCRVSEFTPIESEGKLSRALQLKAGDRQWNLQVFSSVKQSKAAKPATAVEPEAAASRPTSSSPPPKSASPSPSAYDASLTSGLQLLLDVELEASLRFGAREMPLGEILDLGPGDVVQLDRHITDPVDLIIGDKIVARGDVVLVNGNFGLRVTEVAEPQNRLETVRCLF